MDLERDEMRISLQHPSVQSFPTRSQFKTLDVSLNLTSVPFSKVNLHKKVGEMLYNDLGKNLTTISKAHTFIEKVSNRVKMDNANSRDLYI